MKQETQESIAFGLRLKSLRQRAGLTQSQLAQKLGYTTHSAILKIEQGRQDVPITQLPALCKALNCTPMELLGLRPEGDYLVDITPESGTIMERINQLPAARRNELQKTLEILIKGMEGEK